MVPRYHLRAPCCGDFSAADDAADWSSFRNWTKRWSASLYLPYSAVLVVGITRDILLNEQPGWKPSWEQPEE